MTTRESTYMRRTREMVEQYDIALGLAGGVAGLEAQLERIASECDPDARLVDVRLALAITSRDYWEAAAMRESEAVERLAAQIATGEGLEVRSEAWAARIIELEDEARTASV